MYLKRAFLLSLFLHVSVAMLLISFFTLRGKPSEPVRQERFHICLTPQQPTPIPAVPQNVPNVVEEPKAETHPSQPSSKPTPPKPKPKPIATVAPTPALSAPHETLHEEAHPLSAETTTEALMPKPLQHTTDAQENLIAHKIQAALLAAKTYPKRAQRAGMEGAVALCFIWTSAGVKEAHVCQKSKYALLDEHSLETLKQASKTFPSVESPVEIRIVLSYTLK